MHNQLTLESIAKELNEWRNNKSIQQHRIPDNIKGSIKSISNRYTYKQMSKALNIYGRRLKNILATKEAKSNKIEFIQLPTMTSKPKLPIQNLPLTTNPTSCILRHPNGTTMTIEISNQHLTTIIKDFICCN